MRAALMQERFTNGLRTGQAEETPPKPPKAKGGVRGVPPRRPPTPP